MRTTAVVTAPQQSTYYRDVARKREVLRNIYGGMMTFADVMRELGYSDRKSCKSAVDDLGVIPVRIGRSLRYETDSVAKSIVDRRGMA